MGIRMANSFEIQQLLKKQKESTIDFNLTDAEMSYLYTTGMNEIKILLNKLQELIDSLNRTSIGETAIENEAVKSFLNILETYFIQEAYILEGEYDNIIKLFNSKITESELDEARIFLYKNLAKKYLRK